MRENTRLRDLYLLSMEMCFHTEVGIWNNLPDNPWHWGSCKVRLTIRGRSASQLWVCSPDALTTWTHKCFSSFFMHYPLEFYSTRCDRFRSDSTKSSSSPSPPLLPEVERWLDNSPAGNHISQPPCFRHGRGVGLRQWNVSGTVVTSRPQFFRSSWASSGVSLPFPCLEAEESQALWGWWNYNT